MGLYKEIDDATPEQLIVWFKNPPNWDDEDTEDYIPLLLDELGYEIAKRCSKGKEYLKTYTESESINHRRAALCTFASKQDVTDEDLQILTHAFQDEKIIIKNDVMWTLMRIKKYPLSIDDVKKLALHTDNHIVAVAEVYLFYASPKKDKDVDRLRKCLLSDNAWKRHMACDVVGDEDIKELMPELKKLLNDEDEDVREAATSNIY